MHTRRSGRNTTQHKTEQDNATRHDTTLAPTQKQLANAQRDNSTKHQEKHKRTEKHRPRKGSGTPKEKGAQNARHAHWPKKTQSDRRRQQHKQQHRAGNSCRKKRLTKNTQRTGETRSGNAVHRSHKSTRGEQWAQHTRVKDRQNTNENHTKWQALNAGPRQQRYTSTKKRANRTLKHAKGHTGRKETNTDRETTTQHGRKRRNSHTSKGAERRTATDSNTKRRTGSNALPSAHKTKQGGTGRGDEKKEHKKTYKRAQRRRKKGDVRTAAKMAKRHNTPWTCIASKPRPRSEIHTRTRKNKHKTTGKKDTGRREGSRAGTKRTKATNSEQRKFSSKATVAQATSAARKTGTASGKVHFACTRNTQTRKGNQGTDGKCVAQKERQSTHKRTWGVGDRRQKKRHMGKRTRGTGSQASQHAPNQDRQNCTAAARPLMKPSAHAKRGTRQSSKQKRERLRRWRTVSRISRHSACSADSNAARDSTNARARHTHAVRQQ
ncbi:hypothetical protein, conserved in T. vivax [Trypanosoma vivax Y486]|uniref:Uncharacterized protein n=1 Tax=Trypanosoma vivax (strain Y486) TaxID=1055687 RepID=F9WQE6_TRYVY|nr:hypothetical protein, conserved in T. vivax [Trypanosoma vivax Y486]|eukprot:CCD19774.1 hypothetical protein, conserved in T. vivax [Trypanosoma vivax Y486]